MNLLKWLSGLWRKIVWVANIVYNYVAPIYPDVVAIIKMVREEGLEGEAARKEVARRLGLILAQKNIIIPDSVINAIIEIVYQLVKNKKE